MDENNKVVEEVVEETKATAEPEESQQQDEKKYTDADVDAIINKRFAKWKKEQEAKQNEAEKLAKMNADEKADYEREKLLKEVEELRNEKTINGLKDVSRKMLAEAEVSIGDKMLSRLVTLDADETKEAVNEFIADFKEAIAEATKKALRQEEPKASGNNAGAVESYGAQLAKRSNANINSKPF